MSPPRQKQAHQRPSNGDPDEDLPGIKHFGRVTTDRAQMREQKGETQRNCRGVEERIAPHEKKQALELLYPGGEKKQNRTGDVTQRKDELGVDPLIGNLPGNQGRDNGRNRHRPVDPAGLLSVELQGAKQTGGQYRGPRPPDRELQSHHHTHTHIQTPIHLSPPYLFLGSRMSGATPA